MPDPEAQVLARRMDGLPLALATAGAYLRQSPISFADYLRSYEQKWNILQRVARELPEYRERTLYTTWDLSFAQIKRQDPRAASLLTFLAYFDNQEVWYELLAAGQDRERPSWFEELVSDRLIFEGAMRTLVDFCLVEVHVETGSYGLHTCVHDWTLDALNRPIDHSQYALAFNSVVSIVSGIDFDSISTVMNRRRLATHAIRLDHDRFQTLLREDGWTLHIYSDLETLAFFLQAQNKFENAKRMYLRALAGYEKTLEPDHPAKLRVVQNLGLLYHGRGQIKKAEEMWT
jgi:tetratricopeptide (TPR) repeat protein